MANFKVEAEGDTVYFENTTLPAAKEQFESLFGDIPAALVTWTAIDAIPEGEESL